MQAPRAIASICSGDMANSDAGIAAVATTPIKPMVLRPVMASLEWTSR